MIFELTDDQHAHVSGWLTDTVYPEIIAHQKLTFTDPSEFCVHCWESGYPYEGAIGGGITYEFTPTSLGVVQKVKYTTSYKQFELDLTDYKSW